MRTTAFTETQWRLLGLLARAETEDRPVRAATRTRHGDRRGEPATANSTIGDRLVLTGLARWSQPDGLFLLITPFGRIVADANSLDHARHLVNDAAQKGLTDVIV